MKRILIFIHLKVWMRFKYLMGMFINMHFPTLREIELGKYNFKHPYIKLTFKNDKFIIYLILKRRLGSFSSKW